MKTLALIISICLVAAVAGAEEYVPWLHGVGTATTNRVGIIGCWSKAFPNRDDGISRELIYVIAYSFRNTWTEGQRAVWTQARRRLRSGKVRLSDAGLDVWKIPLVRLGLPVRIVRHGESVASFGGKIVVVVVAKESGHGYDRLKRLGLQPEDTAVPIQ